MLAALKDTSPDDQRLPTALPETDRSDALPPTTPTGQKALAHGHTDEELLIVEVNPWSALNRALTPIYLALVMIGFRLAWRRGRTRGLAAATTLTLLGLGYYRLQIFHLCLLRGTSLYRKRRRLGLQHLPSPPYTCVGTPQIAPDEFLRLGVLCQGLNLLRDLADRTPDRRPFAQTFRRDRRILDRLLGTRKSERSGPRDNALTDTSTAGESLKGLSQTFFVRIRGRTDSEVSDFRIWRKSRRTAGRAVSTAPDFSVRHPITDAY